MTKIMYATVKLVVKDDADTECIAGDCYYEFDHPDLVETEWVGCEEKQLINMDSNI